MIEFNNISLVCVTSVSIKASLKALVYSSKKIKFKKILFISNILPDNFENFKNVNFVKINETFNNTKEWGRFIIFDLYKYIETDYICLIHDDGFIVNPDSWSENFLKYDYIGAPWPIPKKKYDKFFRDSDNKLIRVGNSVSIRSKKLLELPSQLGLQWTDPYGYFHEDGFLCVQNRKILIDNGIKFAGFHDSLLFSREKTLINNINIKPFAFHKWYGMNIFYPCFNKSYQLKKLLKKLFK